MEQLPKGVHLSSFPFERSILGDSKMTGWQQLKTKFELSVATKLPHIEKRRGRLDNRVQLRYSGRKRLGFRSFFSLARTTNKIFRKSGNTRELLQNASNRKQSEENSEKQKKL